MKLGEKAKQIISAVAPVLGATLGGPLGGLAGNVLAKTLGVEGDPKALEKTIVAQSPETVAKIRLAEIELEKQAQAQELDLERINAQDRASAREREIRTGDKTPRNLAYTYTAGFFLTLGAQFWLVIGGQEINPVALRLLDATTGVLFAMMLATKDYYFGTSSGSKSKDSMIEKLLSHPPTGGRG